MALKHSFAAIAVIFAIAGSTVNAAFDASAYCPLVSNGFKLGNIDDCDSYFVCQNEKATKYNCPENQAYDKNSQSCKPQSTVTCFFGGGNPCLNVDSGSFVPVPNACTKYTYCESGLPKGQGECPLGFYFKNQQCTPGACSNDDVSDGLTNICYIMPEGKFFGSPVECSEYRYCDGDEVKNGECPTKQVFDVQAVKCTHDNRPDTCSRVTGSETLPNPPATTCKDGQTGLIPDSGNCNVYYDCTNSLRKECQNNYYFSVTDGACMPRQTATPTPSCNRCQFSKQTFVNSVSTDCQGYLLCPAGTPGSCAEDHYFDEAAQACIKDSDGLTKYAKANGACRLCDSCAALKTEDVCGKCPNCSFESDACVEKDSCSDCEALEDEDSCTACTNCKYESDQCTSNGPDCSDCTALTDVECGLCPECELDGTDCIDKATDCSDCSALTETECGLCEAECDFIDPDCVDKVDCTACSALDETECGFCEAECDFIDPNCVDKVDCTACGSLEETECDFCEAECEFVDPDCSDK